MSELRLPHDTLVLIGDGRKALFLRNHGDAKFPDLKVERVFADPNYPDVKKCIVGELPEDLTNHPVYEIEKHLFS